jgi:hypothetical protein
MKYCDEQDQIRAWQSAPNSNVTTMSLWQRYVVV